MKDTKRNKRKYARPHQVREEYGLPEPTTYRLCALKLIKSVHVLRPGCVRGTRLIDLESLDAYLASLAEAQS